MKFICTNFISKGQITWIIQNAIVWIIKTIFFFRKKHLVHILCVRCIIIALCWYLVECLVQLFNIIRHPFIEFDYKS